MLRPSLIPLALPLSFFLLSGCQREQLKADTPEIFIVNRANPKEGAATPFKYGTSLNFPQISGSRGPYWIVFVDQNPCQPALNPQTHQADLTNPKAYKGTQNAPPSCEIRLHPGDFVTPSGRTRDLYFRYAVWFEKDHLHDTPLPPQHPGPPPSPTDPPAWDLPYRAVPCQPVCD